MNPLVRTDDRFPTASSASRWSKSRVEVPADEPPPLPENAEAEVDRQADSSARCGAEGHRHRRDTPSTSSSQACCMARRVVSTVPHARVKSIDTSAAERYPGVRAVHVLDRLAPARRSCGIRRPEPATRYPMVRYLGSAHGRRSPPSRSAPPMLRRSWSRSSTSRLPHVTTLEEAMKEDAPRVFPGPTEQPATAGGGGAHAGPAAAGQRARTRHRPDVRPARAAMSHKALRGGRRGRRGGIPHAGADARAHGAARPWSRTGGTMG